MSDVVVEHNLTKRITLRKELEWLFEDGLAEIKEFNPVDNGVYCDAVDADPQETIRESIFWPRINELAEIIRWDGER